MTRKITAQDEVLDRMPNLRAGAADAILVSRGPNVMSMTDVDILATNAHGVTIATHHYDGTTVRVLDWRTIQDGWEDSTTTLFVPDPDDD